MSNYFDHLLLLLLQFLTLGWVTGRSLCLLNNLLRLLPKSLWQKIVLQCCIKVPSSQLDTSELCQVKRRLHYVLWLSGRCSLLQLQLVKLTAGCEPSECWEDKSSDAIEAGRWLQPGWECRSIWWWSSLPSGSWWCGVLGTGLSSYFVTVILLVDFIMHRSGHPFLLPRLSHYPSLLHFWLKLTSITNPFCYWLLFPSRLLLQTRTWIGSSALVV